MNTEIDRLALEYVSPELRSRFALEVTKLIHQEVIKTVKDVVGIK